MNLWWDSPLVQQWVADGEVCPPIYLGELPTLPTPERSSADRRVQQIIYTAVASAYGQPTVPDDHDDDSEADDDE